MTTEVKMETQYNGPESTEGPGAQVRGIAGNARRRVGQVADRVPEALVRVQSGARNTVTRLQTVPDSGLRLLAAASIGLGAGLRLAGAPRLATLAGLAPASIFGFAIVSRPSATHIEAAPSRP
jgi:hypothetical protein